MIGRPPGQRDHGGGLDAALARYGGARGDWLDLSTGINPVPYPLPALPADAWTALPDRDVARALEQAARRFWAVPDGAAVLAAPGASALIARLPGCLAGNRAMIPAPTYNEHRAAFVAAGWQVEDHLQAGADALVVVHPNNPDGRLWLADAFSAPAVIPVVIIDESFCDIAPASSMIALAARPGVVVLKSFGKFWGLAGVRLGFAIGDPAILARLAEALGPWAVAGPALAIGTAALNDPGWAADTRQRLAQDAARLDGLMTGAGAEVVGGTTLFRLYRVADAAAWHDRLARAQILSRVFPYASDWLRLGLPHPACWAQLQSAL